MDGVAVAAEKHLGPVKPALKVGVRRGDFLGGYRRSFTSGTNAVIMVEDLHQLPTGEVEIIAAVSPWENVRI